LAAVPSIGRAARVERPAVPGAEAATELYERYSGQVFGYCFRQLRSREEAEDAAQTTFMNAFRGLARGIVPELEQAWLFKIAHNVCLSRRRSSWRRRRVEAPNNMEALQEVVPAKESVAEELIPLQDVLEQMPESQRRAILLREWQGLSYSEIGDELDLSRAAVQTLIFRARRALADGLDEAPTRARWRKRAAARRPPKWPALRRHVKPAASN
jgi:RNA polymerase sigma-70 factor, ECF subfamily